MWHMSLIEGVFSPALVLYDEEDNYDVAGVLKLIEAVAEAKLQAVLSLLTSLFKSQLNLISFHQILLLQ